MEKAYELNNEEVANTDIDTVTGDMFEGLGFFDDEKKKEKKLDTEEVVQDNKKTTNKPKDKKVGSEKGKKTNRKVIEQKEVKLEVTEEKVEELSEEQKAEEKVKELRKKLYSMIADELENWPNVHFEQLDVHFEQLDVPANGTVTALVGVEEKYIAMGGKYNSASLYLKLVGAKFTEPALEDAKDNFLKKVDRTVSIDFDRWERTKEKFEEVRETSQFKKEDDSYAYKCIYGKLNREDIVKAQKKYAEKKQRLMNEKRKAS